MSERYFYDEKRDRIIIVTQNPCGCHHCDLLIEFGKRWNEKTSLPFNDDVEIEEYLEKWEEL